MKINQNLFLPETKQVSAVSNPIKTLLVNIVSSTVIVIALSACSGGGAETEENPVVDAPINNVYSGPAPATDDIQNFKREVWDKLSGSNRCGQCHGIGQEPEFVNLNDVNQAYAAANNIVDLSNPAESRMVSKVAEGHNCWESSTVACTDLITKYITDWAGDAASIGNVIQLIAPTIREPGTSKSFPVSPDLFADNVYPLLNQYCADCHNEGSASPISPFFASTDIDTAYAAAKARINLDVPENSRFVVRLRDEAHNCWSDCVDPSDETEGNSGEMLVAIRTMADLIPLTEIDPNLLTSKALFLTDGIVASGGGRHESDVIALWSFKAGSGDQAFDTSGVEPPLNLTLSGNYNWVGGWGIQLIDGLAKGPTNTSNKLHQLITATGEYSIEAWVAPANVTQEGPAAIVSYSAGPAARNFTLGQTLYNYNFLNRSSETNANGEVDVSTADADEILQTALQHVVASFSPTEGRKIYVNGILVAQEEAGSTGGSLIDWDDTFALVMGNEVFGDRLWAGTIRMVAIHNRTLTQEQVSQNFDVGVGEKFFMLFDISHLIDLEESYMMFEVSQWDSYGYLFDKPVFINLNEQNIPDNIELEKIRIAVNGQEVKNGQAYKTLNTTLSADDYDTVLGQSISRLGTVIALEKGAEGDEFFLTFEKIASLENAFTEAAPPVQPEPVDLAASSEYGIRDFFEINASMSSATGISMADPGVSSVYETVKQQMPTLTDINTFVSAQQMGITQLAIKYCDALVEDTSFRANYFTGFDFNAAANVAFDSQTKKDQIFDPLISNIIGDNISTQPLNSDIKDELGQLTDTLTGCGAGCSSDRTEVVVKAICAATLGNAAMLIQ